MNKTRLSLVIVLSFLLSACSSSFVYNNLDWLLYWYLDDYVTLTSEQKAQLDERIESWQTWHRTVELPKYQEQIEQLRKQLTAGPLDQQAWLDVFNRVQQSAQDLRAKIAPELAVLATQLSPEQVDEFLSEWRENIEKRSARRAERNPQEHLTERQQERIEEIENNLGTLTAEQQAIVRRHMEQLVSTSDYRTVYQNRLQRIVKNLFKQSSNEDFSNKLSALIINPNQYKTAEHLAISEQNKAQYALMMAELNRTLSEPQQQKLDQSLNELNTMIQGLIED